ncbi:hemolysin family protein [Deinococcus peraridilitoris]|uniref:CBS domain-containing protein n=1 Tax=Deinococcus peraridilitoris (strain DSM 19664 / LMG 22246 / CIP 109416 / KR-200) TaxID=937777 RepID=K9ZXB7_DEIPD|nr:hemolysin family protein [Deinococcus peraridilitoris]AFZ65844.1 CBS domain-containing protein [Deinococcus peraridilitoris DSM 19664]
MSDIFGLAALFFLVLLNGFFVAAEFALVSVRRTRIDQLAEEGIGAARIAQRAVRNLDLYIAATQLGITMASLGIGFIAEPAIHHLVEGPLSRAGLAEGSVNTASFAIAFSISTILHIVFGELAPKSIALQRSEETSLWVVRPLMAFAFVFRPAIYLLNALGNGVVSLIGLKPVSGHHTAHSEEEIRMIVSASSQEGVLEDDEKELVYNVFDLSDTMLRSIMTPRVDMVLADASATLRRVLELNEEHGYSRVPAYRDTPDNVIGIVHTSDVLKHLQELDHVTIGDIVRPTYYAPESMRVSDLLRTMRERKSHMAIVVDEFGGTAGLVTLEDVLEEIVGEIYDETDEEAEVQVEHLGEGVYRLDASLNIDEVEEVLGVELDGQEEAGEFDTLAGFVTQHFGYIPTVGERFQSEGWEFLVEGADQRRVIQVVASKIQPVPLLESGGDAAYDS